MGSVLIHKFTAFRNNPAFMQFAEIIDMVKELNWIRFEFDEKKVDITLKGTMVARFIPADDGFIMLFPDGPDYGSELEVSADNESGLSGQIRMTADSDTFRARMSIRTAYLWADYLVDDDEWMDI